MHLQAIVMVFQEHLYLQANTQAFKPEGMFYFFFGKPVLLKFFGIFYIIIVFCL